MTMLEKISHSSIIVLSCVALGLLIEHRFIVNSAAPMSETQLAGRTLDVAGGQWQAAPATLVLHLSSTCIYCTQSAPFYERLASARSAHGSPVRLVVVTADPVDVMRNYLATSHFNVDDVLSTDKGVVGRHETPIILVVDSSGIVKRAFVGKLDSAREKEVLSIVEQGRV